MADTARMRPQTLLFVAGLMLMVMVGFAYLGQYCPSCAVASNAEVWGTWIGLFSIGAFLVAISFSWGAKKP
jgi:hypothetical protein